jgi:hypothetical protein
MLGIIPMTEKRMTGPATKAVASMLKIGPAKKGICHLVVMVQSTVVPTYVSSQATRIFETTLTNSMMFNAYDEAFASYE